MGRNKDQNNGRPYASKTRSAIRREQVARSAAKRGDTTKPGPNGGSSQPTQRRR